MRRRGREDARRLIRGFLAAVAGYALGSIVGTLALGSVEPVLGVTGSAALVQAIATLTSIAAARRTAGPQRAPWLESAGMILAVGTIAFAALVATLGHAPVAVVIHGLLVASGGALTITGSSDARTSRAAGAAGGDRAGRRR